jgi:hypothetical protein
VNDSGNTDYLTDGVANNGVGTPLSTNPAAATRLTATATLGLTVLPTNDAPVLNTVSVTTATIPPAPNLTLDEDTPSGLSFSGLTINEAADDAFDPEDILVQVKLSVLHGGITITDSGATRTAFTNALDGADTDEPAVAGTFQSITLRGTVLQLNTALGTLKYFNDEHFNTEDVANFERLTIDVNDLGNSDHFTDGVSDGSTATVLSTDENASTRLTASGTLSLTVRPTNDAPVLDVSSVPPAVLEEDSPAGFAFTGISVSEVPDDMFDPDVVQVQVQLAVQNGGLTITPSGAVVTSSALASDTGSSPDPANVVGSFESITLRGTIAQLNTALGTLVYYNDRNFNTEDTASFSDAL